MDMFLLIYKYTGMYTRKIQYRKTKYLDLILVDSWSKPVPVNDLMYNMG